MQKFQGQSSHQVGGNRKCQYYRRTEIKKSLETEFLNAICSQTGDKWQSKTLFLAIFGPCLLIVKNVFDCPLPGVELEDISRSHIVWNCPFCIFSF